MKPRTRATRRIVAALPEIIARLVSEPGATLITISAELRVGRTTLKGYVHKAMTPEQVRAWVSRVRSESLSRPAGRRPARMPLGTVRERDGQLWIKVSNERQATRSKHGWQQLSRWIWEQANGPITRGRVVYFRDGDPLNCALTNIEMLTPTEKLERLVRAKPEVERQRIDRSTRTRRRNGLMQRVVREARRERQKRTHRPKFKASAKERGRANVLEFLASLDAPRPSPEESAA